MLAIRTSAKSVKNAFVELARKSRKNIQKQRTLIQAFVC